MKNIFSGPENFWSVWSDEILSIEFSIYSQQEIAKSFTRPYDVLECDILPGLNSPAMSNLLSFFNIQKI